MLKADPGASFSPVTTACRILKVLHKRIDTRVFGGLATEICQAAMRAIEDGTVVAFACAAWLRAYGRA